MNLYLSSYRLGRHPEFLRRVAGSTRAVVIANAMDFVPKADRQQAVAREVTDVESLGFSVEELDLRDYFDSDGVSQKIDECGLVWARGGNSFMLRQAMRRSALDVALGRRLQDEGILDYHIAPHYESDHPESESVGRMVEYFKNHGIAYKALHDGEAIVVHGGLEFVV